MNLTRETRSIQVIIRFCLRVAILIVFAAFGSIEFGRSIRALLCMSAAMCAALAVVKREAPLDSVLNHWDEITAYVALGCLITAFDGYSVPI
jgi:hypothetical protein